MSREKDDEISKLGIAGLASQMPFKDEHLVKSELEAVLAIENIEVEIAKLKAEQAKLKCELIEKQIKDFSTFMAEQMKINEAVALCKARKK